MLQDGDGLGDGLVTVMLSMLGLEEKDVKDSDKLASFGVDSMQLAEIRSRLQRAMGRPIPLEEVSCPHITTASWMNYDSLQS